MGELVNTFNWSASRAALFDKCSRAYFLNFYGSWGGWERTAPEATREAYRLKKLSNRWTWSGSVVHEAIRCALERARSGKPDLGLARELELAHWKMKQDFKHSQGEARGRKLRKDFTGLTEHEYREPLSPEDWRGAWESAKTAIEGFYAGRWLPLARTLRPDQWLCIDEPDFDLSAFEFEGVRVFAVPDFAYIDEQGTVRIIDWKTGRPRENADATLAGYALYLESRFKFKAAACRATLVYLTEGVEREVRIDHSAIEEFRSNVRRSVGLMRELLAEPTSNTPRPQEAFPMTDNLATCARCAFRRVCNREEQQT
jgi:hypothetical protein